MLQERVRLADHVHTVENYPVPGFAYRDITSLLQDPEAFREAIDTMVWHYQDQAIDAIVGIEPHGYLFGAPLAYLLNASMVIVRTQGDIPGKKIEEEGYLHYGTERIELSADAIKPGMRVVVVEDMLATGQTLHAACELVTRAGGHVIEAACLIELTEHNGRQAMGDYPVFSLIKG